MLDIWSIATTLIKLVLYVGILTAAGTAFCAALFRLNDWAPTAKTFAWVGIFAAALSFSLKGAALTGDVSGMTDPEMLTLLWGTPVGSALLWQIIGLTLILIGTRLGRLGLILAVSGGIMAVWAMSVIGHISDKGSTLLEALIVLHLIVAAFWIGILSPLYKLASNSEEWRETALLGRKFGRIASILVPAMIVAGSYMAYQLVGSLEALITSSYGQALLLKVALVACLLLLAARNKLRYVPELEKGELGAAIGLKKSIADEWVLVITILLVTAILTSNVRLPS